MLPFITTILTIITACYICQFGFLILYFTLFVDDIIDDHIQYNNRNNTNHSIYYWLIPIIPFAIVFIRNFRNALKKLDEVNK